MALVAPRPAEVAGGRAEVAVGSEEATASQGAAEAGAGAGPGVAAEGEEQAEAKGAGRRRPKGPKEKPLVLSLFGEERNLGVFPTVLHSDLRHLVEMLRRGKKPRLCEERVDALEAALAAPGSAVDSLGGLRQQVEAWRSGAQRSFDAESYYDRERAEGYTRRMQGPQESLAARTLQLSSLASALAPGSDVRRQGLLAVDLGCGTGLSSQVAARLPGYAVGVIGVDLSSEMLRSPNWNELVSSKAPLAAERVRCDLAQPLPFRRRVLDVAYSVAAVHYIAGDTEQRSAESRLDSLLHGLRQCLAPDARPCTFQAFLTKEPQALQRFRDAAARTGWALCDLVVDQAHGGSGAPRDFLYLLPEAPPQPGPPRPPRCALHRATAGPAATCAMALQDWCQERGVAPVELDCAHRAWLEREHDRYARRLVRLHRRCQGAAASLDHAAPPDAEAAGLAERLAAALGAQGGAPERTGAASIVDSTADGPLTFVGSDRHKQVLAVLHSEP